MIGRVVFFWFIAAIIILITYGLWETSESVNKLLGKQPGIIQYAATAFMAFVAIIFIIAPFIKFPEKTKES